jgi:ABC-2 type transport system permease protein
MGRLWAVIKREYLERVRTKWFVFATIFAPVLMTALLIVPIWLIGKSGGSSDFAHMTILDASGVGLGARVQAELGGGLMAADTSRTQVIVVPPAELAAAESASTHAVMRKETNGYLVLGPRILDDTVARYAGRNASSIIDVQRVGEAVRREVLAKRLEQAGVDAEKVISLTRAKRLDLQTEQIGDRGREGSGMVKYFFSFAIAFLLYTSILIYGQTVLRSVLEEKQTRVAEVVVSSISTDTLLAGKVLGVGAVGLTQQILWVIMTLILTNAREPVMRAMHLPTTPIKIPSISPGVLALLMLFFMLGFILYSALFAAVGAMVNTDQEAQQAQQPFMLLLVATVILIQPVLLNPTTKLAVGASIFPFSAPILMPVRLSLMAVPWWQLAASLGSMIVTIVIAIWLASRIYRVGLLMYGKRPTIREVARWVSRA